MFLHIYVCSDTLGFGCYNSPDAILTIRNCEHLYVIVPAPLSPVPGSFKPQMPSQIECRASLAACSTNSLQSLIIEPMTKCLQELTTKKTKYQMKVETLEAELRSMKQKKNRIAEWKKKEFKALLKTEKDQVERDLKAILNAEKVEWQKEFEARMEVEVKMREQIKRVLRAELKLEKEECEIELEEPKAKTMKSLQNVMYALFQALLRNVSLFYSCLYIIHHLVAYSIGLDSYAHPTSLSCPG